MSQVCVLKPYVWIVSTCSESNKSIYFRRRHTSTLIELVKERNLLSNLSQCLLETVRSASFIPGTPGAPPPAGASSDIINDLDSRISPSSSLTAAILALLGFFGVEGRDEESMVQLDRELNDLLYHGLGDGSVGGGDSRHHGRSAVARSGTAIQSNQMRLGYDADAQHSSLLDRTAALVPATLDPAHTVLSHRRYSVCISDLKCVLNVDGMSRHFASFPTDPKKKSTSFHYLANVLNDNKCSTALDDWIKVRLLKNSPMNCCFTHNFSI